MKKSLICLSVVSLVVILLACQHFTIQKRVHRGGFYIHKSSDPDKPPSRDKKSESRTINSEFNKLSGHRTYKAGSDEDQQLSAAHTDLPPASTKFRPFIQIQGGPAINKEKSTLQQDSTARKAKRKLNPYRLMYWSYLPLSLAVFFFANPIHMVGYIFLLIAHWFHRRSKKLELKDPGIPPSDKEKRKARRLRRAARVFSWIGAVTIFFVILLLALEFTIYFFWPYLLMNAMLIMAISMDRRRHREAMRDSGKYQNEVKAESVADEKSRKARRRAHIFLLLYWLFIGVAIASPFFLPVAIPLMILTIIYKSLEVRHGLDAKAGVVPLQAGTNETTLTEAARKNARNALIYLLVILPLLSLLTLLFLEESYGYILILTGPPMLLFLLLSILALVKAMVRGKRILKAHERSEQFIGKPKARFAFMTGWVVLSCIYLLLAGAVSGLLLFFGN